MADGGSAVRAGLTLWLGWLLVTGLTFSFMAGIFHPYYTVALAPAIGALVGIGALVLWQHRDSLVAAGVARAHHRLHGRLVLRAAGARRVLAPVAAVRRRDGRLRRRAADRRCTPPVGRAATSGGRGRAARRPGRPRGVLPGDGGDAALRLDPECRAVVRRLRRTGWRAVGCRAGTARRDGTGTAPARGGASTGGLLDGSTPSAALTGLLETDASSYTWVAAAIGSNSAAGYQLATQEPVMAIGGFNGSDPSPTLAQFQAWVARGEDPLLHRAAVRAASAAPAAEVPAPAAAPPRRSPSWVESTFTAQTVDGVTVYDLTAAVG